MTTSICQNGGEWVFSGKTNALDCKGSNEVKFAHYNKLNSYTFESTTQIIDLVLGDKISFCNNFSYSKVVTAFLPKNITEIRGNSFLYTSLNTIYINSKYIRITGADSFNYLFTMKNIYFAGSLEDWMNCDFTYSVGGANNRTPKLYLNGDRENYTSDFIVPSSIKIIKPFVFRCIYTDTITLHEEVTEIGSNAMSWNNIKEINIPKSVAKIGSFSFYFASLVNVTLNWTDEILPFNSKWYLGSKTRTLNVPLRYVQNYIDAGYLYNESTNTSGFGTITDGVTTVTWNTYQPTT